MSPRSLLLAALVASLPAQAYELKRDSTGASVRWAARAQFVVDEHANGLLGENRVFTALQASVHILGHAAPGISLSVRAGPTQGVGYDKAKGATNQSEIVVVSNDWPFDATAVAVTVVTVNLTTHEILDADIAFNAMAYRFGVLGDDGSIHSESDQGRGNETADQRRQPELYDIQNTFTHELGHAVGFTHNADATSMMYPSTHAGEVTKRKLNVDDTEGLVFLYPAGSSAPAQETSAQEISAPDEQQVGCASGGGNTALWMLLLFAPLLLRKSRTGRRVVVLATLIAPVIVLGFNPKRQEARAKQAAMVATAEVKSLRTLQPAAGTRLFVTEVELLVRTCLKGSCAATVIVQMPGGRVGNLEQLVDGMPLPARGELVGITVDTASPTPVLHQSSVYRLSELRDFVAFAKGLSAAGLETRLPLPGSALPSGGAPTSPGAR
jgi:hypothetical protein